MQLKALLPYAPLIRSSCTDRVDNIRLMLSETALVIAGIPFELRLLKSQGRRRFKSLKILKELLKFVIPAYAGI